MMSPRSNGLRTYENAPMTQSVVDQVVFGRDMDFSGETQFDEDFAKMMYDGCAGKKSWEVGPEGVKTELSEDFPLMAPPRRPGVRTYLNAPMCQSIVDQVVFGRDMDFSGDTQFDEEFTSVMYGGCSGKASWLEHPEGLRTYDVEPGKRRPGDPVPLNKHEIKAAKVLRQKRAALASQLRHGNQLLGSSSLGQTEPPVRRR